MGKKKTKLIKKPVKEPQVIPADDLDHFLCPNCRSDNFQLRSKTAIDDGERDVVVVECIDCGERYDVELAECCDDCKIDQ